MSSIFKIYSPEDCDFYYDGEFQGHIIGNSDRAFRFEVEKKGTYRLKFINSEYKSELIEKVSIDAYEEREVELNFSEANERVIRERERIIIAIEHDYESGEQLPEEIISEISKNGIVTIPNGVRKIGNRAFANCSSLTSITIPDSVTEIGKCAFLRCSSLNSIAIPDSVTEIWDEAFIGCSGLTSISIPNNDTAIRAYAFCNCKSLTSITIPDSIWLIGHYAFDNCINLKSVYCKATTPPKMCDIITVQTFRGNAPNRKIYVPKSEGSTVLERYKSEASWIFYADNIEEYDFDNE